MSAVEARAAAEAAASARAAAARFSEADERFYHALEADAAVDTVKRDA